MSKAVQLKKRASEFEQKKQYDRALAMYIQAIEAASAPDEIDIPVYNRVGDLHLRLGSLEQAVTYYEMAVDLYAESGFFNNAIALCNKVLRHAPSRSAIYYKLGKISARKGFNSDAKQNFLEYADRMQKAGEIDEAFRALKEFADLCPGQDDVRLMLADQLARAGRSAEALEQLHIVYDAMVAEDRATEAAATLERMRAIEPTVQPKRSASQRSEKRDGLVFLDIDSNYGPPVQARASSVSEPEIEEEGEAPPGPEAGGARQGFKTEEASAEGSPAGFVPSDAPFAPPTIPAHPRDALFEATAFSPESVAELPPSIVDEPTTFVSEPTWTDAVSTRGLPVEQHEPAPPPAELPPEPVPDAAPLESPPAVAPTRAMHPPVTDVPVSSVATPSPPPAVPKERPAPRSDDEFVDLQAWLQETEPPKNPRMTAAYEEPPEGTIQTDFAEMLDMFKRGVAENVDESDLESHYDLGVAYMEMELFEEAISQFQKAMRGNAAPDRRVRVYESLGKCFIELGQYDVAVASLSGALQERGQTDGTLVGVLYLLGVASEALHDWRQAAAYYKRVFAVDINFRDIGERLRRATRASTAPAAS